MVLVEVPRASRLSLLLDIRLADSLLPLGLLLLLVLLEALLPLVVLTVLLPLLMLESIAPKSGDHVGPGLVQGKGCTVNSVQGRGQCSGLDWCRTA